VPLCQRESIEGEGGYVVNEKVAEVHKGSDKLGRETVDREDVEDGEES